MPSASVASVPAITWRSGALSSGFAAAKMLRAGGVEQAHVNVQAAARHVAIGLGQEGRLAAVRARHALDDALEAQRLVADPQRIGRVREIHLVLARAVFGERRGGGHVLQRGTRDRSRLAAASTR